MSDPLAWLSSARRRGLAAKRAALSLSAAVLLGGCHNGIVNRFAAVLPFHRRTSNTVTASSLSPAQKIVAKAKQQIGTEFTAAYFVIPYPNGDLPTTDLGHLQGGSGDVVVRSLRAAGVDLQKLIHEDLVNHFRAYPHRSGNKHPDSSMDHRRIPNQVVWFKRHGISLPVAVAATTIRQWQPGDIVYWKLAGDFDHCGILSDKRAPDGLPLVIHNLGGCREEPVLRAWKIVGHFRYPVPAR